MGILWLNTCMTLKTTARSILYQSEKTVQRIRFASLPVPQEGWPILLGISFPKSGTHLLDQILLGFSKVAPFSKRPHSFYAEYEGESGAKRAPEQVPRAARQHADRDPGPGECTGSFHRRAVAAEGEHHVVVASALGRELCRVSRTRGAHQVARHAFTLERGARDSLESRAAA